MVRGNTCQQGNTLWHNTGALHQANVLPFTLVLTQFLSLALSTVISVVRPITEDSVLVLFWLRNVRCTFFDLDFPAKLEPGGRPKSMSVIIIVNQSVCGWCNLSTAITPSNHYLLHADKFKQKVVFCQFDMVSVQTFGRSRASLALIWSRVSGLYSVFTLFLDLIWFPTSPG